MSDSEKNRNGAFSGIRAVLESLMDMVSIRLELFSVEFREEKLRLVEMLFLVGAVCLFGFLAAATITATIVVLCWETEARNWVLAGFALLYAALCIGAASLVNKRAKEGHRPFAATLEEFRKDRECFSKRN